MKKTTRKSTKSKAAGPLKRAAEKSSRFTMPPAVIRAIAYSIIATAVVLSWFKTPIPVAIGFTILAVIRVGITIREDRREQASTDTVCTLSGSR